MTTPLGNPPHNCVLTHRPQPPEADVKHPLLSLPVEVLDTITGYVTTGETAVANAIGWGRVCASTHLMTHESHIDAIITHAKHLDEALIILWNRIASRLAGAPQMTRAQEIRRWMKDPNNAQSLATIKIVTLSGCGLKVVPPEINMLCNLHMLELSRNQITQIGPEAFEGCPALHTLNLNDNQITHVGPKAFAGCSNLQELRLENNKIAHVGPEAFEGCPALHMLNLHNNKIAQIGPKAFAGCLSLQTLQLQNNQITHVGPEAFEGCRAHELWLNKNRITQVDPGAFAGCLSLQTLYLGDNQITQIDLLTFAGCRALRTLYLWRNQITQIAPKAFAGCLSLQTLDLSNNQIAHVGPEIFAGCGALHHLYLAYNQITRVGPETFAGCLSLQTLDLSSNQIAQVDPKGFAGCGALRALNLWGNLLLLGEPNLNNKQTALGRFNAFSSYVCRSELATFYKAVSEGGLLVSEIVAHLKQLEGRNLIYEMVYWEAKAAAEREERVFSTDADLQWGEHHVCDDRAIFHRALRKAVQERYDHLSAEQKCAVHERIYEIAREDGSLSPDDLTWFLPDRWGKDHREENVLRFIDAMAWI